MWTHRYEETTNLTPALLWPTLANVVRWPEIDRNIDWLRIEAPPAPGVPFVLKPKWGPKLNFTIDDFAAPDRYSDICRMPGAEMQTRHSLIPEGGGTRIRVDIEIRGHFAPLWGWIVGRKHAAGLPAQTARFIEYARERV